MVQFSFALLPLCCGSEQSQEYSNFWSHGPDEWDEAGPVCWPDESCVLGSGLGLSIALSLPLRAGIGPWGPSTALPSYPLPLGLGLWGLALPLPGPAQQDLAL